MRKMRQKFVKARQTETKTKQVLSYPTLLRIGGIFNFSVLLGFISGHSGKKTHHSSTTCNQFLNKRTFQKLITLKVKTVRKKRKQVEFDECELLC